MDHPCLDEIDLAEFTDLLKRKASEKHVPLSGSVEVTAGCTSIVSTATLDRNRQTRPEN